MNVLCDVKIIGETVEYSAHKAVLASFSKYFEVSIYVKVLNMCGTYILFYWMGVDVCVSSGRQCF